MMFDSASLSEFLSQAEYISKISEYDRTMLTAYQETKNLIAEKSEQLQTAQADLETMSARAEAKRESLASLQEAKNEELSSLNLQIADHSDLLADYDEALKRSWKSSRIWRRPFERRRPRKPDGQQKAPGKP